MTKCIVRCGYSLTLIFITYNICYAQQASSNFKHISTLNNLSSSFVTDITQDHFGFIWIATNDGLNKYDGYTIKEYKNNFNDPYSLCDNKINDLFVDSKGRLWIGTENNGLNLYDKEHDNFIHFGYNQEDGRTLSFRYVTSIEEDNFGNIWVATLKGLNKYDESQNNFIRKHRKIQLALYDFSYERLKQHEIPDNIINTLSSLRDSVIYTRGNFKKTIQALIGNENTNKYYEYIEEAAFTDVIGVK